jgi:hypothetical protein
MSTSLARATDLDSVASVQLGLITTSQLREAGLSPSQIKRRVASGRLLQLRRRVYLVEGAPRVPEQRVLAPILAAREGGIEVAATDRSAGSQWGMWNVWAPPMPSLTVAGTTQRRLSGVVVRRSELLLPTDIRPVGCVPTTTAERTICDLAATLRPDHLGHVIDDSIRRRLTTMNRIVACFETLKEAAPNRAGMRVLTTELARRTKRVPGGSRAELDLWDVLLGSGLPMPVQQFKVVIDGKTYYLDYAWPQWKITLEYDSWDYHDGAFVDHVRDRSRITALNLAGWMYVAATEASTRASVIRDATRAIDQRTR